MRGAVHHIDLSVKDPKAARPFWDAVLGFMGYAVSTNYSHGGYDFDCGTRGGDFVSIGIRPVSGPNAARPHDRYSSGLHHIAWNAQSRADVDALHALLVKIGATVTDPPAHYPEYSEGYYAVFFQDPDGLKLEYCFVPA
ncbi:MAG TPA: VOC family protein [Rhizomicrobium sp.]|nr:VOC family protein [Rhizomicrobium sp.]